MSDLPIIDVHSHAVALKAFTRRRDAASSARGPGDWTPDATLSMMDRHGIGEGILSPIPMSFDAMSPDEARDQARSLNEELASIAAGSKRFGAFGVLPMLRVEDAIAEAEYVLNVLKLDGVCMATNAGGVYPGDPRYAPLFDALNQREAVIFIHPATPSVFNDISLGIDGATLEFMFDSTRMITSLVYNGVIRRCPALKIISTHGGGVLPYIADRIATHAETRNAGRIPPTSRAEVMDDLRSIYFDLTAAMNAPALAAIIELVPKSHLLSGFDYPIRPERLYEGDLKALSSFHGLGEQDRRAIRRDNALALFPRFAAA